MSLKAWFHALGQVLAHQSIGVLVDAALPGAVRVAEVDSHACLLGQFLVQGHLAALIIGQAQAHQLSDAVELVREGLQRVGGAGGLEWRLVTRLFVLPRLGG